MYEDKGAYEVMIILNCSSISKSYGINRIIQDVSFNIQDGDKVGLVGVNGAGKTTLFKIMTGEISPDTGEVHKSKELKIGYLTQNTIMDSEKCIWDEMLQAFQPLIEMEGRIKALEHEMAHTTGVQLEGLVRTHADLCEEFKEQNGYGYISHIRAVLVGLGFEDEQFSLPIKNLSGGQKTRVALGKLLLQKPRLLLLDEPTNHLDIQAVEWLETFMSNYKGSIIVISHDRYFLDSVTNRTIEIENKKAYIYDGNYSGFIKKKAIQREQQLNKYTLQQKEISRIQGIIKQQKQWNREKNIKTAESKQKMIDRMEKVDKVEELPSAIHFNFQSGVSSGKDILFAEELSKSYGENHLFKDIHFQIRKGDRIFLLGGNGTGKTTLFKILLNQVSTDSGTLRWGKNVEIGYYDQEQTDMNSNNTLVDEVWDANPKLTQTEIRNALAAFLFRGDDVFKKISSLSGGEKGRVALVKLMLSQPNFLLLDEPTNHLDINSCEVLEKALAEYDGTLFVISHDRYFINKIASRVFELNPTGINEYIGNYDAYNEKRKESIIEAQTPESISDSKQDYQDQKLQKASERKIKKIIGRIEVEITECEISINDYEQQLCTPEISCDYEKAMEITNYINTLKEKLEKLYDEWEEILINQCE